MLKGPKAILSSAIANALGTYFEVDASAIESNLITDAKIVLNQVKLKKQTSRLALNSSGNATVFTVTGGVERVELSWEWSVGYSSQQLVKNSKLCIKNAVFQCMLEHEKQGIENRLLPLHAGSFVDAAAIDADTQQEIKDVGGIKGYIIRQVKMIIDTLTLKIDGLDLQIILPVALTMGEESEERCGNSKTILICADELQLLSFGRKDGDDKELTIDSDDKRSVVKQKLSMRSFFISILKVGTEEDSKEYPLIDPFSYSANVTKTGDRFSDLYTGLKVQGCVDMTSSSRRLNLDQHTDALVFHVGDHQIDALMQLSMMVLSPPTDEDQQTPQSVKTSNNNTPTPGASNGSIMKASFSSSPSSFHFPLASLSLVLFDNSHAVHVTGVDMCYKADGTVCSVAASKMEYESAEGGNMLCHGMLMTARPTRKLKFGSIETLHVPNQFELTSPTSPEILFEGKVLVMRVQQRIDVLVYGKSSSSSPDATAEKSAWPLLPCGIEFFFPEINITKDVDESKMMLKSLEVYANPTKDCTQVAIKCAEFKNHLALLTKMEMSCSLPVSECNTVNDLNISVRKGEVKGGHASEEWSNGFRPRPKEESNKDERAEHTVMKLPNVNIATLKLLITWSQTGIAVKDTSFAIKPFHGNAKTTSDDLIAYYTSACLAKFPAFISNAEVMGINIVDNTVNTIGTYTLLPFFGGFGGVAALTGVDAIKGAVASGKRARSADDTDDYRPGDFIRGVFHAATEATRDGMNMRGKGEDDAGDGNIIDWAVGATKGTADYVVQNKAKLGAAGAGGGGFLAGMALGGPVGAVIGGVIGNLAGGKTIEAVDDKLNQSRDITGKLAIEQGTSENTTPTC